MKETQTIKFKAEWTKLQEKRTKTDHELARLAFEIRGMFQSGTNGRAEAVDWFRSELGMLSNAARVAVSNGEAWACVRDAEHWVAIGGLASARLVAALTPKQRLVVVAEAVTVADERKRPVSATMVRAIAWKHGFVEKEAPKITEAKKVTTLMAFVNRLYATVHGLPPMPADIRSIVKPAVKRLAKAA